MSQQAQQEFHHSPSGVNFNLAKTPFPPIKPKAGNAINISKKDKKDNEDNKDNKNDAESDGWVTCAKFLFGLGNLALPPITFFTDIYNWRENSKSNPKHNQHSYPLLAISAGMVGAGAFLYYAPKVFDHGVFQHGPSDSLLWAAIVVAWCILVASRMLGACVGISLTIANTPAKAEGEKEKLKAIRIKNSFCAGFFGSSAQDVRKLLASCCCDVPSTTVGEPSRSSSNGQALESSVAERVNYVAIG